MITTASLSPPPRLALAREPRLDARHAVHLPALWLHREGPRQVVIRQVSLGGFALESEHTLLLRHLLRFQMVLPNSGKPFVLHAMIMRRFSLQNESGAPMFGASVFALDHDARRTWSELVQHASSHFGERAA